MLSAGWTDIGTVSRQSVPAGVHLRPPVTDHSFIAIVSVLTVGFAFQPVNSICREPEIELRKDTMYCRLLDCLPLFGPHSMGHYAADCSIRGAKVVTSKNRLIS